MFVGKRKDGGPLSKVTGWFVEAKRVATLAVLRFGPGSREAYHSHAFDCVSLVVGPGQLRETFVDGSERVHKPGTILVTRKSDLHKVYSEGTTWVLTLRGRWGAHWYEVGEDNRLVKMGHGRKEVTSYGPKYHPIFGYSLRAIRDHGLRVGVDG